MKFSEAQIEKASAELLANKNFSHRLGETISRAAEEVLVEEDLQKFFLRQHEKEELTVTEAKFISKTRTSAIRVNQKSS
jgi:hypothetical protein